MTKYKDEILELTKLSHRSLPEAVCKTTEELGEVSSAMFALTSYKKGKPEDLAEELVDLVQCVESLICIYEIKYGKFDWDSIMKCKLDSWKQKYGKGSNEVIEIEY